jgi:hypothetical protein
MKQSLIITVVICLFLGESFTLIAKKGSQKNNTTTYCCSKICDDKKADEKAKGSLQPEPYLPMVNMLRL